MRSTVFIRSVLALTLLNGAVVFNAQASSLANEFNRISNTCEDSSAQLAKTSEKSAGGASSSVGKDLNTPSSVTDSAGTGEINGVNYRSNSAQATTVNSSSCDGLMAVLSANTSKAAPTTQAIDPAGLAVAYISQSNAVPLPAAAWLFSSALFGFIVVANRRKI